MKKEEYLDGLRGIAAFIVVIHHYILGFYPALGSGNINEVRTQSGIEVFIAKTPFNLFGYGGNLAVCIFFILSGYVLTYKFFKFNDDKSIASSAIRRYFRLMPPMLFSVVIAYILMKLGLFYNQEVARITSSTWLASYYNFEPNFIEAIKQVIYGIFLGKSASYNSVLWTMYYELWGSFIVLGIVSVFGKVKNRYIIYMIITLLVINTYFFPFVLGMILCDLYNGKNNFKDKINKVWAKFVLIILGLYFASFTGISIKTSIYRFLDTSIFKDLNCFYHTIGALLLIVVLLNSIKLKKVFSNKIFTFMGSISFSSYLIHWIFLNTFSCYLFLKLSGYFRYYQVFLIMLIISLTIIVFISHYVYKYIDLGSGKLANKIYKKYFYKSE